MTDWIGQTIGSYQIEERLGVGGMGQVFRARHKYHGRLVALKLLHEHLAADPIRREGFLQEARAIAALRHQNIVDVDTFSEYNGRLYLVMELVTGGSLHDLLQRITRSGEAMPLDLGVDLVRQAADGLSYAHERGFIHRDIKPGNLLLSSVNGASRELYVLKIGDFGLAKLIEGSSASIDQWPMGTAAYMSPEQCRNDPLDHRSDLYALGVVLYEVVTGKLPFAVTTWIDATHKHINEAPPAPRRDRPDIPPALEAIILRCLAKKPEDRFESAAALCEALPRALDPEWQLPPLPPQPSGSAQTVDEGQLLLAVDQETIALIPGQPIRIRVTLTNRRRTAEQVNLAVEGVPKSWVLGMQSSVRAEPGAETSVAINVHIPHSWESQAGQYPVTIRARSRSTPSLSASVLVLWVIRPFRESTIILTPPKKSAYRQATYRVSVQNTGNERASYRFTGRDDQQVLDYTFTPERATLNPSETIHVGLRIDRQGWHVAGTQPYRFEVTAQAANAEAQSVEGTFVQTGVIPIRLRTVIIILLILLPALFYIFRVLPSGL